MGETKVGGGDTRSIGAPPRPPPWRWLIIPLCGILGLAVGILWVISIPPTYTANAFAVVAMSPRAPDDPSLQDSFSGGPFAIERAPTYAALATSTDVLRAVVADTHQGDVDGLRAKVAASAVPNTLMLQFAVSDADPEVAVQIANSVMANLARSVSFLELGGSGFLELGGGKPALAPVQILPVQPALLAPLGPSWYEPVGGLIAGLAIGCAVFFLIRRRGDAGGRRGGLS